MKPFYRKKGKYADGRDVIYIEDRENNSTTALPKPEIMLKILKNNDTKKKR